MVQLDKEQVREKYETLDSIGFIEWLTDGYLAAVGGALKEELDRPFAFMIYDSRNDQIMFIGKVTEL